MDIMGTRETPMFLHREVCGIKPINGKIIQTTFGESDQFIVSLKQSNARGGNSRRTVGSGTNPPHKEQVKDGNKIGLITYLINDKEVL
jgi:hypothetical protein